MSAWASIRKEVSVLPPYCQTNRIGGLRLNVVGGERIFLLLPGVGRSL